MKKSILFSIAVLSGPLFNSCSGGGDEAVSHPINSTGTGVIGVQGGQLYDSNGTIIDVPAGALNQDTTISIKTHVNAASLPSPAPFTCGAHFEPEGLQFATPATITLQLNQALPEGTILPLFIYNSAQGAWSPTPFSLVVNADEITATGEIDHFSDYISFGPPHNDANMLYIQREVSDVCNYRPFTEIFDDFVNRVSQTFEVGSKKILDFSSAETNVPRPEACYE